MTRVFAGLLPAIAACALWAAAAHGAEGAPPPENLDAVAARVRSIFDVKCVECHGEQLAHPKGHFGYVLDLGRVAANPKMIVSRNPADSELYQLVLDDEMPGDDAKSPPLTPEEKETVKHWIELGAPPEKPLAVQPPVITQAQPPRPPLSFARRCVRALGLLHPPSAHFPIALIIAAAPAELMWIVTGRRSWKDVVRFCIGFGAVCAIFTASLGWCDAAFSNYTGESAPVLFWHRWVGTATALLAASAAGFCEFSHPETRKTARVWFRIILLGSVVLVGAAGYLGGSLIYGLDHFRW